MPFNRAKLDEYIADLKPVPNANNTIRMVSEKRAGIIYDKLFAEKAPMSMVANEVRDRAFINMLVAFADTGTSDKQMFDHNVAFKVWSDKELTKSVSVDLGKCVRIIRGKAGKREKETTLRAFCRFYALEVMRALKKIKRSPALCVKYGISPDFYYLAFDFADGIPVFWEGGKLSNEEVNAIQCATFANTQPKAGQSSEIITSVSHVYRPGTMNTTSQGRIINPSRMIEQK